MRGVGVCAAKQERSSPSAAARVATRRVRPVAAPPRTHRRGGAASQQKQRRIAAAAPYPSNPLCQHHIKQRSHALHTATPCDAAAVGERQAAERRLSRLRRREVVVRMMMDFRPPATLYERLGVDLSVGGHAVNQQQQWRGRGRASRARPDRSWSSRQQREESCVAFIKTAPQLRRQLPPAHADHANAITRMQYVYCRRPRAKFGLPTFV